ncbi:PucR family transcriptional regulator ligand-binding domain-containing protein [Streptomyces sp. NBC_00259]|uniref:PucR family transcriptional regulator ligand-binding domain-containing protein n=1 Tax=Streptomyces sp. NBC_00259 TaxID=2903643 RepID=UPI002E2D1D20|nr:PucR family transcriptional regulator ligand-binding domain-containing protein [Streptomyces sp. NBC_00259]
MPDRTAHTPAPLAPSAPSAPPAPPVPLTALLAREDLGLRLVTGPEDVDIQWVHTSEMADPYPYLLGGELLLTAGVLLEDPEMYAARVVEAGGAAIGFGVAPVYDTVPDALVAACERHRLPLIEVPPQTPFTAIARAVWRLMAQARLREVRRVSEAQQGLAVAAARPDPVPAVLHQLASRLGGWAVLLAPDGSALQMAGRAPSREAREALGRLARVVSPEADDEEEGAGDPGSRAGAGQPEAGGPSPAAGGSAGDGRPPGDGRSGPDGLSPADTRTEPGAPAAGTARRPPSSATDSVGDTHLAAYALGGAEGLVLGVAAEGRESGGHTIAGVAVVLLSLLTAPHQGTGATGRAAALVRLLLGAAPAEVAPALGHGPWTVVHGTRPGQPDRIAASALGAALGSALVDADGETVRILLSGDRRIEPQPGWTLGVSAPAGPADLAAADTAAARALRRAEATRVPLARQRDAGLGELIAPDEAATHARTLLAPVADSPALTETLRVWLSLHGSWDRTAVALGVHRNTVRQRIARCAMLLGVDLDDADVRMELWFALRYV